MSRVLKLSFLLICMVVQLVVPSSADSYSNDLSGAKTQDNDTSAKAAVVDGQMFLDKIVNAANAMQDYSFLYEMTVFKSKALVERGRVYFKKPRLLRIEILGPNRKGSVAILGPDGKVHAHMGGGFSFYVATLSPDSSLLRCANGFPMVDSDFASIALYCKNMVKQGDIATVTTDTSKDPDLNLPVYTLDVRDPNGVLLKRGVVDAQSFLPVKWFNYAKGKMTDETVWTELKTNQKLADSLFDIKATN